MKGTRKFYSIISLLLCVLMIFSAFALVSCKDSSNSDGGETEELKAVVRAKAEILKGERIAGYHLETVKVPISGIPEGAIESIDKIVGKYAAESVVEGEYVFDRMLTDKAPEKHVATVSYIVVSDRIEKANERDITAELQALIDEHPGTTLYFNDGTYTISSTIYLPTDKAKAVSIRLSNYAVIKAASSWTADTAMISVGGKTEAASAERAANSVSGGKLDGAGVAKIGLSLENCANTFVSNVTFENLKNSLTIKSSANTVNVESVTVKGNGADDSVGIINESSRSVFSAVNIANANTGLRNSGSFNEFRNVSVKCNKASTSSIGFSEMGNENVFSLCTAEDFSKAYAIKDGAKSVFDGNSALWTKADITVQEAFYASGTFNSVISACTARFFDASSQNTYINLTTKGSGIIKTPFFDEELCDNDSYKTVLSGTVISLK
ncbi:MAG: hypothetical protein J6U68_01685 [Clostridia bacterium]|nr:hypothetical protein [Clostridia bacterium]